MTQHFRERFGRKRDDEVASVVRSLVSLNLSDSGHPLTPALAAQILRDNAQRLDEVADDIYPARPSLMARVRRALLQGDEPFWKWVVRVVLLPAAVFIVFLLVYLYGAVL